MRTNCLFWALTQTAKHGGYIICRKSDWGWWPHFLWSQDLKTFHAFEPVKRHRRRIIPPLIFTGRVNYQAK